MKCYDFICYLPLKRRLGTQHLSILLQCTDKPTNHHRHAAESHKCCLLELLLTLFFPGKVLHGLRPDCVERQGDRPALSFLVVLRDVFGGGMFSTPLLDEGGSELGAE